MARIFSHSSATVNSLPYNNESLLCFITQRTSFVKPCWLINSYCDFFLSPLDKALLPQLQFARLFPSLPNIFVHSHFSLRCLISLEVHFLFNKSVCFANDI